MSSEYETPSQHDIKAAQDAKLLALWRRAWTARELLREAPYAHHANAGQAKAVSEALDALGKPPEE